MGQDNHTEHKIDLEHTTAEVAHPPGHNEHAGGEVLDTIFFSNIINVIIVILFFVWLFRKFNLLSFIGKRKEEILEALKNLEQEKKIKQNYLKETKIKVQNVNREVEKIIDDGEQVAESISERIIKEAEEEAAEIQKKAHALIESERKVASNRVVQEVTTAAFVIAEQHIKEAIDHRLQHKYINEFIDSLDNVKV